MLTKPPSNTRASGCKISSPGRGPSTTNGSATAASAAALMIKEPKHSPALPCTVAASSRAASVDDRARRAEEERAEASFPPRATTK